MNHITDLISQLCKEHFYGSLTLKFESGKIVILKKEETIKPQPPTDIESEKRDYERNNE